MPRPAPEDLPTRPEEMFCFAVYSASHVINRAYAPLLKPLGLTYPQYIALTCLWEQDGLSVGELSARLMMESSTLTPLLKRLEKLGHVERRRGTQDERKVFVRLQESGKALKQQAPEVTGCMIGATGMEVRQLDTIVSLLDRLKQNLITQEKQDAA